MRFNSYRSYLRHWARKLDTKIQITTLRDPTGMRYFDSDPGGWCYWSAIPRKAEKLIVFNWDDSPEAFYCGLHELGHAAKANQLDYPEVNEREAEAWLWAWANCPDSWKEEERFWALAIECLSSYTDSESLAIQLLGL